MNNEVEEEEFNKNYDDYFPDTRENLFKPKGEKPEWYILYKLFRDEPFDTIIPYQVLASAIGLDWSDFKHQRKLSRIVSGKVMYELLKRKKKNVEAIDNVGYRIVFPKEQIDLAKKHQLKARRQLFKTRNNVKHIDHNYLTEEERTIATTAVILVESQIHFNDRVSVRRREQDKALNSLHKSVDLSEEQKEHIKKQKERLKKQSGFISNDN